MIMYHPRQMWRNSVVKFWQAGGRGGKEAREEEMEIQTNRQEYNWVQAVGLGKGKMKGRKSRIFN